MAVKLNKRAFAHAKELLGDGKVVLDERDAWSEHQPSAEQENELLRQHGFKEYAKWYGRNSPPALLSLLSRNDFGC
jgi:hypothetical protein